MKNRREGFLKNEMKNEGVTKNELKIKNPLTFWIVKGLKKGRENKKTYKEENRLIYI